MDELKGAGVRNSVIVLAEKDEATREMLKGQLIKEQVSNYSLLENALDLGTIKLPDDVQTLLILVDPFVLDDETWRVIAAAVGKLVKSGMSAVLELFTFDKERAIVHWPAPPAGMIGPISVIHRPPYHLAVYATDILREQVGHECQALGWNYQQNGPLC